MLPLLCPARHKCEEQHGIPKCKQRYNVCLDFGLSTHLELTYCCWMVNKTDVLGKFSCQYCPTGETFVCSSLLLPTCCHFYWRFCHIACFFLCSVFCFLHVLWDFVNYFYLNMKYGPNNIWECIIIWIFGVIFDIFCLFNTKASTNFKCALLHMCQHRMLFLNSNEQTFSKVIGI